MIENCNPAIHYYISPFPNKIICTILLYKFPLPSYERDTPQSQQLEPDDEINNARMLEKTLSSRLQFANVLGSGVEEL